MATVLAPIDDRVGVSCAMEVFIATALLHREHPERPDFTIQEIVNRAAVENMSGSLRSGINVHASQHCVANKAPNPAKHRMLYATGKHTRRLLLPGDEIKSGRNGRIFPEVGEVPERYLPLLEWAKHRYNSSDVGPARSQSSNSPTQPPKRRHLQAFLDARGIGIEMAKGIDPDEYIRQLREGWE